MDPLARFFGDAVTSSGAECERVENGIGHERGNVGEREKVQVEDEDEEGRDCTMMSMKDASEEDGIRGFNCDDENPIPDGDGDESGDVTRVKNGS